MHISRAPQIQAGGSVSGASIANGEPSKRRMPSLGTLVGWGLFLFACVASVYFMYTGDVQRVL
eukprot:SAG22_NODE_9791_length_569_cov_1.204255_1_plen_62_part_10